MPRQTGAAIAREPTFVPRTFLKPALIGEERCFLCEARGVKDPKPVYAKRVCQPHYQKAHRLKISPEKLLELMDIAPRLPFNEGVQVSPRISKTAHAALEWAVKQQGMAKSVYKLAAHILEKWADENPAPMEPKQDEEG